MPIEEGGLGHSGFVGVLAFLLLMFLFVKVSKVGSTIFGFIGYMILRIRLVGTDRITEIITSKEFIYMVLFLIGYFVLMSYLDKPSGSDDRTSKETRGNVCPRCGRNMEFVPAREVPTGSGELVEGKGEWVYDYSDSQTKSKWVVPKTRVYETRTVPAHYECPNCGYSSR